MMSGTTRQLDIESKIALKLFIQFQETARYERLGETDRLISEQHALQLSSYKMVKRLLQS